MNLIELKNISVSYDKKNMILDNLNLRIEKGELVSLLGPSGCGKTTTLRVIAGFIQPSSGHFLLNEEDYTNLPVYKRNFGFVFQSYALFPHLSVFDNVAFGLKLRKLSKEEIKDRVDKILEITDLSELANRLPKNMSGGQRQRVALARALVIKPDLLLLDEPLSNLDAKLRLSMRVQIKKIQKALNITTVFVTHDQEECFSISDKVALMNNGKIEMYDTPENIYNYPSTCFVAKFIGFENFFDLKRIDNENFSLINDFQIKSNKTKHATDSDIVGTIRPDDIEFSKIGLLATISIRTFLGNSYQYIVNSEIGNLVVNSNQKPVLNANDKVFLKFKENKTIILNRRS